MSHEDFTKHYRVDASRMLELVMHFPDQVEEAWRAVKSFRAPAARGKAP